MENTKRFYRSRKHKMLGGVAGGLAEYFKVDVILVRLLFVLVFLAVGGGLLIYLILWIITPLEPYSAQQDAKEDQPDERQGNNNRALLFGISMILIGFFYLLDAFLPDLQIKLFWPVVLIVAGVMLIMNEMLPKDATVKAEDRSKNEDDPSKGVVPEVHLQKSVNEESSTTANPNKQ